MSKFKSLLAALKTQFTMPPAPMKVLTSYKVTGQVVAVDRSFEFSNGASSELLILDLYVQGGEDSGAYKKEFPYLSVKLRSVAKGCMEESYAKLLSWRDSDVSITATLVTYEETSGQHCVRLAAGSDFLDLGNRYLKV